MNKIACGYCMDCTEIADLKKEVARLRAALEKVAVRECPADCRDCKAEARDALKYGGAS